jgi:RNA polymerase sigma factor (sigma-70 family)
MDMQWTRWLPKLAREWWRCYRRMLVLKWQYLPRFVVHSKMYHSVAVKKLGCDEAVAEGCLALVRAARGYDPRRGFAFSTYATRTIACEITKKGAYQGRHGERSRAAAERMRVEPLFDVDPPDHRGDESEALEREEQRAADAKRLGKMLSRINPREREVVELSYLHGWDNATIGRQLLMTRERVRQLLKRGIARLKDMA